MKQHFDEIKHSNLTSHRVPQSLPYSVFFQQNIATKVHTELNKL